MTPDESDTVVLPGVGTMSAAGRQDLLVGAFLLVAIASVVIANVYSLILLVALSICVIVLVSSHVPRSGVPRLDPVFYFYYLAGVLAAIVLL